MEIRMALTFASNNLLMMSLFCSFVKPQKNLADATPLNNTTSYTVTTVNHMLSLRDHLFDTYGDIHVRPVKDGKSTTVVTFRMLLHSLLNMDTKNQKLKIATWLKMSWRDEFVQWNPSDYGDIDVMQVPATSLWRPDVTLHSNTEDSFELFKSGTFANIYPEGEVIWYVPTIYGSTCLQKVRYFPFDQQECTMKFSSWAYDGTELELRVETGADSEQIHFKDNGVWSFISVTHKVNKFHYNCCPEPFYDLVYTINFRRNSGFYVTYLILPCIFLSALSLLVFLLPPESGEKLTLSVTNLLALVVFQQLIAETMPPSGKEGPLLGTYFLTMIIMVCFSVIATVFVLNISYQPRRMPPWIKIIFLDILAKVVCLNTLQDDDMDTEIPEPSPQTTIGATPCDEPKRGMLSMNVGYSDIELPALATDTTNGLNSTIITDRNMTKILSNMTFIKNEMACQSDKENQQLQWKRVSTVIDRCLFIIFIIFAITMTFIIGIYICLGSEQI